MGLVGPQASGKGLGQVFLGFSHVGSGHSSQVGSLLAGRFGPFLAGQVGSLLAGPVGSILAGRVGSHFSRVGSGQADLI